MKKQTFDRCWSTITCQPAVCHPQAMSKYLEKCCVCIYFLTLYEYVVSDIKDRTFSKNTVFFCHTRPSIFKTQCHVSLCLCSCFWKYFQLTTMLQLNVPFPPLLSHLSYLSFNETKEKHCDFKVLPNYEKWR